MLTDHEGYDGGNGAIDLFARGLTTGRRRLLEAATIHTTWQFGGANLRETVHREFDVASAKNRRKI